MNIESFRKVDLIVLVSTGLLILIGGLNVFGTTYFPDKVPSGLFYNQLLFYAIGLVLLLSIGITNYKLLNRKVIQIGIFLLTLLLLILVLFIGDEVLGATRWINFGGFAIQPSEFAKLGLILINAYILSLEKPLNRKKIRFKPYLFILDHFIAFKLVLSAMLLGLFAVLIMMQNSLGNTLLISGIWLIMLLTYFPLNKHIVGSITVGTTAFVLSTFILPYTSFWIFLFIVAVSFNLIYYVSKKLGLNTMLLIILFILIIPFRPAVEFGYNNILKDYQKSRIETFINPESDPAASWNLRQVKIATASGKIFGKGFLQGTHTNYKFLPFSYNDFAFSALAEQFGFVGLLVIASIFGLLLNRITGIGRMTKDNFGRLIVFGVSGMIFLNMFQHMGMNVGVLPITGVPLPFISYGGSTTLVMMIGIGLVISVGVYGERAAKVKKHKLVANSRLR